MHQYVYIDLDRLSTTIELEESGRMVRHSFNLANDRSGANYMREVFDMPEGDELPEDDAALERAARFASQDELCNDPRMGDVVCWIARGVWGMPMRFQRAQEEPEPEPEEEPGEEPAEPEPGEIAPAPRPEPVEFPAPHPTKT